MSGLALVPVVLCPTVRSMALGFFGFAFFVFDRAAFFFGFVFGFEFVFVAGFSFVAFFAGRRDHRAGVDRQGDRLGRGGAAARDQQQRGQEAEKELAHS